MNACHDEIRSALMRSEKGLTARQLLSACDSAGDVNEIVKEVHALKTRGRVKADGMRESQVVYKIADWPQVTAVPEAPKPQAPAAAQKSRRSFSTLREGLFDMLDRQADGKVEPNAAKAYANTAMAILKSLEVQLELERLRHAKQLPQTLDDTPLVPMLEAK